MEFAFNLTVAAVAVGVGAVLVVFAFWLRRGLTPDPDAPLSRRGAALIAVLDFFQNNVLGGISPRLARSLFPLVVTMFLYILFCNWAGILPIPYLLPPTQNVSVTLGLAVMVYALTHYYGVREKGLLRHLKGYLEPFPFLLPMNIIGDLGRSLSHGFRLFGNMLGGGLLIAVTPVVVTRLFALFFGPVLGGILVPPTVTVMFVVLNAWFGLFAGTIQALVFTLLAVAYIQGTAE